MRTPRLKKGKMKSVLKNIFYFLFLFPLLPFGEAGSLNAQTGTLAGKVTDSKTGEALFGATVAIEGTSFGTTTDLDGYYTINNIPTKTYNVVADYLGYTAFTKYNVVVRSEGNIDVNFSMEESAITLEELVVRPNPFEKLRETPLSIQKLSQEEIASCPGGNNDIAKVVQSLPGVSGSVGGFRNDVIIRGGAPNENVYYLDGIEIPNINHFATQGSAGGPVGLLNVSFFEGVSLTTSSFGSQYDNALSGVLQFDQRNGNAKKFGGNIRLGASESGLTLEGPLFKKEKERSNTTFIVSARRSYLQFLFKAIGLPFLPDYWDWQYKVHHKIDDYNEIIFTGVGASDDFSINELDEYDEDQQATQDQVPIIKQYSNANGVIWKRRFKDNSGLMQTTLSSNLLINNFLRFKDNINQTGLVFENDSREQETKLRYKLTRFSEKWTSSYGFSLQHANYKNSTADLINDFRYNTSLGFFRYGLFAQTSVKLNEERLSLTMGLRADGNTFTDSGNEIYRTLSPRAALSYKLTPDGIWNANFSLGRYFKLPPYTILGFANNQNINVNQNAEYIRSDHVVAGLEYLITKNARITLEGFLKLYDNYPVSITDSVSLANKGGGFEVLGNEPIASVGKGRTYGFEALYQQKFNGRFYAIAAYTFYSSQFTGFDESQYIRSVWDNQHLISLTAGVKLKGNWEISTRYRYLGNTPYAPVNESLTLANYPAILVDYDRLGEVELDPFSQLDFRVDKKFNFKKWSLDVYLDIQNLLASPSPSPPSYGLLRDEQGAIVNPQQLKILPTETSGTVLPSLGLLIIGFLVFGCKTDIPTPVQQAASQLPETIDYNFHVRPILSENCFSCHGPDEAKRKSGVRLDVAEEAYASSPTTGQRPIVAKSISRSELVNRILTSDTELQMPPPDSKLDLNHTEKAILIKWIEQGAKYKKHWAFEKPKTPALPAVQQTDWVQNEIDHFILRKLEDRQLSPSKKADKEILIRRAAFDIMGLPPDIETIDDFLADDSDDASQREDRDWFTKLVDQFLNSPAYGERMAAYWMEIARYADSDGYLDDKHRDFSPYRDWVIKAFNDNMPYDQFVTWQLAGDLLPNPSKEQILATAFNRLHKKNSEAGIVLEEYRTEYVSDRTNTFGKAFLGMTMECARCHSHKYDPISHEDYYSLFAFFNSTNEIGHAVYGPDITPGPSLLLTDEEVDKQLNFLQTALKKQEEKLVTTQKESILKETEKINKISANEILADLKKSEQAYYPFDTIITTKEGKTISPNNNSKDTPANISEPLLTKGVQGNAWLNSDYNSALLGEKMGWFERTEPFSIDLWVRPDRVYDDASVFLHAEDWRLGKKGYGLHLRDNHLRFFLAHAYPQNALEVQTLSRLSPNEWTHLSITYDGSSKANGVQIYLNGKVAQVKHLNDNLYKGILYNYSIHTYGSPKFRLGKRDGLKPMDGGAIDEIRIFEKELTALEVMALHDTNATDELVGKHLIKENQALLEKYWQSKNEAVISKQTELQITRDSLNALLNRIPEIMVMGDLAEPRPTFVLDRGSYDSPTKQVEPNTPKSILSFPSNLASNRLGLSKWLFQKDNPLTARVFVNHVWQMHFGNALVKTTEDFGNQGAIPTHPLLLDWLAIQFMESDWDIKALHKLIMLSATYQQSSQLNASLLEQDPENQLLARMNRFRLPAEMIRDNALAISDLLVEKIGGPSVYPYQPQGLWDEISNKHWRYPYLEGAGDGLYRRSLYTIWKRTAPPPSMLIFDANDRTNCTVKRKTTNTPLQALVLLNDPQYLEAARVLAEKILMQTQSIEEQVNLACRYTLGRLAKAEEEKNLKALFEKELTIFKNDKEKLEEYLSIGYLEKNKTVDSAACAALAVIINALMNTDEGSARS